MSNAYGHRPNMGAHISGGSARLNELLDAIRQEFEAHAQENPMQRIQREDFEHKRMFYGENYYLTLNNNCTD